MVYSSKINGETNSLIQNWSTPARQTPYDGVDGRNGDTGPTMVYRGVYGSSKVYYGTSKRVDAVNITDTIMLPEWMPEMAFKSCTYRYCLLE